MNGPASPFDLLQFRKELVDGTVLAPVLDRLDTLSKRISEPAAVLERTTGELHDLNMNVRNMTAVLQRLTDKL
jgi:hypothetical protein